MIYNVRLSVVSLIEATSPEDAIRKLRACLDTRGFVPLDDDDGHAFESDDQAIEPDFR